MKKLFISFAAVALLAGCNLFGGDPAPPKIEEGQVPTEKQFDTYAASMHKVWSEKILDMVPEISIPEKSQNSLNAMVNFNIPQSGTVEINLTSTSENDFSDEQYPEGDQKVLFTMNLEPDSASQYGGMPQLDVDTELMLKMVKKKMFFSLAKLKLSIPGIPTDVYDSMLEPFIGNWYGGSFEDLEKILQEKGLPADFSQMQNGFSIKKSLDIKGPLSDVLPNLHFLKLVEALPASGGMALFKVELDQQLAKKSGDEIMDFLHDMVVEKSNMPDYMRTEIDRDFEDSKEELRLFIDQLKIEGILAISQKNSEYFTFMGDVTYEAETGKISLKWLENEKMLSITDPDDQEPAFLVQMTTSGDEDTFTLESPKEKETLITGKKSPDMFQMTVYDPDRMNQEVVLFNIDLNRDGDDYNGKITIPETDAVINIKKLTLDINNFLMQADVTVASQKMGEADISWNIEEVSSVNISEPDNFEGFDKLVEQLESAMANFMMAPPPADVDYGDQDFDPEMFEGDFDPSMFEEDFDPSMFEGELPQ